MAKLKKLHICGIRSFGPDEVDVQQISFDNSVTLILGQNGCGKTTILESVKYALTGELPAGSSSGQGFINDPDISGKTSIKGQIRLKISDSRDRDITIIRSAQVSKSRTGLLTFKTLDTSLKYKSNDQPEGSAVSGRCTNISSYCAEVLQVSPVILNNVLLCHQENSSWPLEQGQKLKERFDEIFDSAKYNKCVELYRKLIKSKEADLKVLKISLEHNKEKKEWVVRQEIKLEEKENDLKTKEEKIKSREAELAPFERRFREIREVEENYVELEKKLSSKQSSKKGIIEQQKTIQKNITVDFDGTDEELEFKIESFQKDRYEDEKIINDLRTKKIEIENKEKDISNDIQKLQIKIGQLKEEQRQFEQKRCERISFIEHAKDRLDVPDIVDDDNIDSVIEKLKSEHDKREENLTEVILVRTADENVLQDKIDSVRAKQVSVEQSLEHKKQSVTDCEKKVNDLTCRLEELNFSSSNLMLIDNEVKKKDKTMESLRSNIDEKEVLSLIQKYKSELQSMEEKQNELDNDYKKAQKNSNLTEKIDNQKQIVAKKQSEINKLQTKNLTNMETLFGNNKPSKFRTAVQDLQNKNEEIINNLKTKINEKQKSTNTLEYKKSSHTEKIKGFEKQIEINRKKINDICKGKDFEVFQREIEKTRDSLYKDKATCTAGKVMYESFIRKFEEEEPCCPVCKTDFKSRTSAVQSIISTLKGEIEDVPRRLARIEVELKKHEKLRNTLQQLKPMNDDINILTDETLPVLKVELKNISDEYSSACNDLSQLNQQLVKPQEIVNICKNFITDAAFLDEYTNDVLSAKQSIYQAECQLLEVGCSLSLEELEAEMHNIKIDISAKRKQIEDSKLKLDQHKKRIQELQEEKTLLTQKLLQLQSDIQGKSEIEKQLKEYQEKSKALKDDIFELKQKYQQISEELREAVGEKDALISQSAKEIQKLRDRSAADKKILDNIDSVSNQIKEYLDKNKDDIICAAVDSLARLKEKMETYASRKSKIIETTSKIREDLVAREANFRELQNIVLLREKKKEELQLDREIVDLERQLGDRDISSILREKRQLQKTYETIANEVSKIEGQQEQLRKEITEMRTELNKPENKNARREFLSKFYELEVEESVVSDLKKYVRALEDAILEFHKEKMHQINRTIRELWRGIYRGNDIDYIEIKPEESVGAGKKRSYNYKVIQIKRGVEIEMRGRCSAGQKVLACLVIRMALAEIFSSTCGILALDEPTTNLDRENIISLSDALSRIITNRQLEKNFQLLIITHDEDFLNTLVHVQNVDHYFKVSRNQSGFSVITREFL